MRIINFIKPIIHNSVCHTIGLICFVNCMALGQKDMFDFDPEKILKEGLESVADCETSTQKYRFTAIDEKRIESDFERIIAGLKIEKNNFSDKTLSLTTDSSTRKNPSTINLEIEAVLDKNNRNIAAKNQILHLSNTISGFQLIVNGQSYYDIKLIEKGDEPLTLKAKAFLIFQTEPIKVVFDKSEIGAEKVYQKVKYQLKYFDKNFVVFDILGEPSKIDYTFLNGNDYSIFCKSYYLTSNKLKLYETLNANYEINIPFGEEAYAMVLVTTSETEKIVFEQKKPKKVIMKEISIDL